MDKIYELALYRIRKSISQQAYVKVLKKIREQLNNNENPLYNWLEKWGNSVMLSVVGDVSM